MRIGPDRVGFRGLLLLAAAALVGIGLAVHGYGRGVVVGSAGIQALRSTDSPSPSHAGTRHQTSPPATAASPSPSGPSQKLGPLLSSTQFAGYAYRIYPGPETSRTRQATAGFTVQVNPRAGAIVVSIAPTGSNQSAQTATYPSSDRVYFIETTFGDDATDVDYNGGDDGLVVTNAQGYVVQ